MLKILFFCLFLSCIMVLSYAQDSSVRKGWPVYLEQETYPQGTHIYRKFPVYPPGKTYFFEESQMRSFSVSLIPKKELDLLSLEEVEAAKKKIDEAADYIETNAVSLGWELVSKDIDQAEASISYAFRKEEEEIIREVEVLIKTGEPISLNGTFSLPEDFGRITYDFKVNEKY